MSSPDLVPDLQLVKIGKAAIRVRETWRRYMNSSPCDEDDFHRAYDDAAIEMDKLIDDYSGSLKEEDDG